jgi:hypothetical protein
MLQHILQKKCAHRLVKHPNTGVMPERLCFFGKIATCVNIKKNTKTQNLKKITHVIFKTKSA